MKLTSLVRSTFLVASFAVVAAGCAASESGDLPPSTSGDSGVGKEGGVDTGPFGFNR